MTRRRKWIVGGVAATVVVLAVIHRLDLVSDHRVHSYAYVTGCECEHVADSQYCDVAYRIPATPLATEPDGPHPELRHGGTVVRHRERDPLWGCDDIDHTWLPVRYDASDPSDASLDLPVGSGGKFLLIALGVLGMWHGVPKVWKRWRAWRRARRERRWQDVREKHHLGER